MADNLKKKLLIVAGEPSGDFYAASLIDTLLQTEIFDIYAIGGTQTAKKDVTLLYDSSDWAAIGLFESFKKAPGLILILRQLKKFLAQKQPDIIVLVDYPGFNMRLVHIAKKMGIPTVYYFPPSKFATNPDKVKDAAGAISAVAANFISTFEVYKAAGANVEFVGHPLLDHAKPSMSKKETLEWIGLEPDKPVIGLCPGSRRSELCQLLPVMLQAGKIIHKNHPEYQFIVPIISTKGEYVCGVSKHALRKQLESSGIPVKLAEGNIYDVMNVSKLLLISSGTATLEASYVGTPMIICYKVSLFTEIQARLFYKLPEFIGLPNIIINKMAIPELIQHDLTPQNLANKAMHILNSSQIYEKQKLELNEIVSHLGKPGAHNRVVKLVLDLIKKNN